MQAATQYDIRTAITADVDAVTATLAAAFLDGDLAGWLIPDREERLAVYPDYFRMFAEFFLERGQVDVTDDVNGVALWLPVGDQLELDIPDYDSRLAKICGTAVGRFVLLDMATGAHHPRKRPHHYLSHLAVHPTRQGHGVGSALLRHGHARLDREGAAAYLEATGARTVRLYGRHGYRSTTYPAPIPRGPDLFPMWRARRDRPRRP